MYIYPLLYLMLLFLNHIHALKSHGFHRRLRGDLMTKSLLIHSFRREEPWGHVVRNVRGSSKGVDPDKTRGMKGNVVSKKKNIDVKDDCSHFDSCSGCLVRSNFQDIDIVKQAKSFFRDINVDFPIKMGPVCGWRTHSKLAVQPIDPFNKQLGIKIGLYEAGTHVVRSTHSCVVHHPAINEAIECVRICANAAGVTGFVSGNAKQASRGQLRYVQCSVQRKTGKVQLVLVWNARLFKEAGSSLPQLIKLLTTGPNADLWHSIFINFHTSDSNAILNFDSSAWQRVYGQPFMLETIGRVKVFLVPQAFRQANLDAFESILLPEVLRSIPSNSRLAELFAGSGTIGLNALLSTNAVSLHCSDSNPFGEAAFVKSVSSLENLGIIPVFQPLSAAEAILSPSVCDAETLIMNPPRKGLGDEVLLALSRKSAAVFPDTKKLVYISCGFDSLARDLRHLLGSGRWQLVSALGCILFPGSNHIETVVTLESIVSKR